MNNVIRTIAGTCFIILCTLIDIDLHLGEINIPITGQSFAVVVVGYLLLSKWGSLAVVFYILLGIAGLPVFADGGSGVGALMGNSGGYLYGFIPAAYFTGVLHEKKWITFPKILGAMIIGTLIILMIGVTHLSFKIGFADALTYGLYPFIPGAIVKILLAGIVCYFLRTTLVKLPT